jgi:hypothetical protein
MTIQRRAYTNLGSRIIREQEKSILAKKNSAAPAAIFSRKA